MATPQCGRGAHLYPTKALAQDQAWALHALKLKTLRPAIYDGDTPRAERAAIRKRSNLNLTNPDMLHVGILPNHGAWGELFANLAAVVVDEAHVYRGAFGSHVGNVLRRLRRIAAAYGTKPLASCSPRRRSPTPSTWPRASPAWTTSRSWIATGRREWPAASRSGTPLCSTRRWARGAPSC